MTDDKRPREYAAEILRLNSEARASGLSNVPDHLKNWVADLVDDALDKEAAGIKTGKIEIEITHNMRNTAQERAKAIEAMVKGIKNHSGITPPDRYVIGQLGEFAFYQWAKGCGLRFGFVGTQVPKSKNELRKFAKLPDAYCYMKESGNEKSIEIKTSGARRRDSLLALPVCMQDRGQSEHDFYIGAKIQGDEKSVHLIGFISNAEFHRIKFKRKLLIENWCVDFSSLHSMHIFETMLMKKPEEKE